MVLIDDTLSYIDAWEKHAASIAWADHPWAMARSGIMTIVGIHYDFLGKHPDFLTQKMIEEFLALYGKDYTSQPFMQPFLNLPDLCANQKEDRKRGNCIII